MSWDIIEGKWKQFAGKAKEAWGELSEDDIDKIDGQRDQLEGRIQEAYGKSKAEAREEVNSWLSRVSNM